MNIFSRLLNPKNAIVRQESKFVRALENVAKDPGAMSEQQLQKLHRQIDNITKDINNSIDEISGTNYRIYTISDWLTAQRQADQPWHSNYQSSWVELEDIFLNMSSDSQIMAATDILVDGLQEKEFYIADQDGDKLDEVTKMFRKKWFFDFLGIVVDSRLKGFNLLQIEEYNRANETIKVGVVNRKHVRPDLKGVVKQQYDQTPFIFYEKEPVKTWTVEIFESKLGKYNACVRWWIYKTEISRIWAKYTQLFGVPPVIAKTSLKDAVRKTNLINALKGWIKSRWMVIDEGDEIEQGSGTSSGSGQQYFENLMRFADEQISKALLGSTMVLDNGSSRSQGEVHERNTQSIIKSLARLSGFICNDELIPRLRKIGMQIPEGAHLIWDDSEKLTMKERAEVIDIVSQTYNIDKDIVSEFIGIEVVEKEEQEVSNAE